VTEALIRRAQALREGGHTERLHTVPHHQEASVAKHSWNMATLLLVLHPRHSHQLLLAVLLHDVAERWIGDTPAPAKYSIHPALAPVLHEAESRVEGVLGITPDLMPEEKLWLKALDMLELVLFAEDELALGNRHMEQTLKNARSVLNGDWVPALVREFARLYTWSRTNDIMSGEKMEELAHEHHTTR